MSLRTTWGPQSRLPPDLPARQPFPFLGVEGGEGAEVGVEEEEEDGQEGVGPFAREPPLEDKREKPLKLTSHPSQCHRQFLLVRMLPFGQKKVMRAICLHPDLVGVVASRRWTR